MTRISQYVWPVLAMLASLGAVFALTWVFSEPPAPAPEPTGQPSSLPTPTPTPEPRENYGLIMVARGVTTTGGAAKDWDVANFLQFSGEQVCLVPALTDDGWRPSAEDRSWSAAPDGSWCRQIAPDQTVDLKFVK